MTHPARKLTFDELWDGLQAAKAERLVSENIGHDGLRLFCYSDSCVYDKGWNDITMLARGIILDPESQADRGHSLPQVLQRRANGSIPFPTCLRDV